MSVPVTEELRRLFESFALELRAGLKSDNTITTYGEAVGQLAQWLAASKEPPDVVREIGAAHVRGYLESLRAAGRAPATVSNRYRGLRSFFTFLEAEGEIDRHPMDGIAFPQVPEVPVPVLEPEQVSALLATCATRGFRDVRDAAIICVLYDTGARRAELLGLDTPDMDLRLQVIHVLGKGSKPRSSPFGMKTARAVDRYLRARTRHEHAHLDALWLTHRGRLKASGLRTILRRRGERAGLGPIHPHQLRHSWAHEFLDSGGQERDLMVLAGWVSSEMVGRYAKSTAVKRAHSAYRQRSPGDRLL